MPRVTPGDIGPLLWWRADDVTGISNGSALTSPVPDASGNSLTGALGGSPTFQTNIQNSLPAVRLNGTSDYLQASPPATGGWAASSITVFIAAILRSSSGSTSGRYVTMRNSADSNDYNQTHSVLLYRAGGTKIGVFRNSADVGTSGTVTTGTAFIGGMVLDGTNAWEFLNGTAGTSGASSGALSIDRFMVGAGFVTSAVAEWTPLDILEVIVFAGQLSSGNQAQIDSYLSDRWAITVSDYVPAGVTPTGISSAGAFGTPAVSLNVGPAGIASAETFGTAAVSLNVAPTGIATAGAFGTAAVSLNISLTGLASAEALGTPTVSVLGGVLPTGISSGEAFGIVVVSTGTLLYFLGPTVEERTDRLFKETEGISVLKENGVYVQTRWPTSERVAAAEKAYLGGRRHPITQADANELIAAGYGAYIVSE